MNEKVHGSRDASFEMLRCVLMFLIVVGHCKGWGIYANSAFAGSKLFSALTWHVDAFVAISGWFGIRFSWRKMVRLWGLFAFYTFLVAILTFSYFRENYGHDAWIVGGGWFGGTYLLLMCFSPMLNAAVENLYSQSRFALLSAWGVLSFAFFANWAPYHFQTGISASGAESHTIMTMIYVYITARTARVLRLDQLNCRWWLLGCMVAYCMTALVLPASLRCRVAYNSPATIAMAIAVVVICARIKLPQAVSRGARFLAPSMFGVYLLHDTFRVGHPVIQKIQVYLSQNGGGGNI